MGTRCITGLWITLTFLFTVAIAFAMLSPVWFENVTEVSMELSTTYVVPRPNATHKIQPNYDAYDPVSFGLIRYCNRQDLHDIIWKCRFYKNLKELPSIAWTITTIIYAIGLVFFVISIFLSTFGICASEETGDKLKISAAYIQVIGVGFLAISVLMFPLGLDSGFARDVCGLDAGMFIADNCQVAWGYVLSIMTVSLTIFCPILAKYSTEVKHDDEDYMSFEYNKSECISLTTSSTSKVMTTV